jgi:hypothetical protein
LFFKFNSIPLQSLWFDTLNIALSYGICSIASGNLLLIFWSTKYHISIFLGYSTSSRASRVYNTRTKVVMESVNVVIDDEYITDQIEEEQVEVQKTTDKIEGEKAELFKKYTTCSEVVPADTHQNDEDIDERSVTPQSPNSHLVVKEPSSRVKLNHPQDNLLGTINEGRRLRNRVVNQVSHSCYLSQLEPKKITEALKDESWVTAMHEELHQFIRNDVWTMVPRPQEQNVIGTKWIFKNKSDAHGTVVRNKARLVAQGYT